MNKAVFLDRDGTINKEKNYLYKIDDFEFIPGVLEGLRKLQDLGLLLVIVTNQSGIARGYYTEEDFQKLNNWMISKLNENGIVVSGVYYCPHLPDAKIERYKKDCICRKPKLGLFTRASIDLNINVNNSYAIGDRLRDCSICKDTTCRGFVIRNEEYEDVTDGSCYIGKVTFVDSFLSAVEQIESIENGECDI